MMMHHPLKSGCKKISPSVDMVETVILDYMSHYYEYDPQLEDSKPIFLQNTLAYDDASPYQVWYKRSCSWGDIIQMNIH